MKFQNKYMHLRMFLTKVYFLLGYECEEHNNPADFFLDTIVTMEQNCKLKYLQVINTGTEGRI